MTGQMTRNRAAATLFMIVALLVAATGSALAQGNGAARGGPIQLKAVTFNPSAGEQPAIPPGLAGRAPALGVRGYYIVQFAGPVRQAWKDAVTAQGAELLDYIPDYAFKARMTPQQTVRVRQLADVVYVGLFHPFYAVSPDIAGDGAQLLRVTVERGGDAQAVANAAQAAGADLLGAEGGRLIVGANRAQLEQIARAVDVAWIEPYLLNEKHNESAAAIIGVTGPGGAGGARARGYDGSTQIAAVADTGIGGGTAATAHRDIPSSRVTAVYNWPGVTDSCFQTIQNDGAVDVDSGHGTHVAGSVLAGGDPAGFGMGMAPAARLVMQATENYVITSNLCKTFYGYPNDYYLTGLNDLYGLFNQAYTAGARVHANSWGAAAAGAYNANSVTADQFIWDKKDMTITFSAGNEGIDANANGEIDNDSIGAPATAKNVITVGASENDGAEDGGTFPCDTGLTYQSRDAYQPNTTCSGMGGNNILGTYGTRWPADYPANPIASDPSGGNAQQMAAFSSRGPTDDGRIKPDVVAPGTWILSAYSNQHREGYGDPINTIVNRYQMDGWGMPRNAFYKYFGGTSMSNPVAAGGAVVVRDYYQKAHSLNASAALVKATMINTAVDLLDENNDGVNDNDFPIPNNHEGWGRINIDSATDGSEKFLDVSSGLATGASKAYDVTLAGGPLKITLVWSDYPAAANAAVTLVNNLNLTVTAPNGTTTYLGNVFSGGWSATGGSADARNTVENVYIQSPTAGTWKITVNAANVPQSTQPFALVVGGAASVTEVAPPPPTTPAAPSNLTATGANRQVTLTWTDNSSNETGFKIERCTGATCTNFTQIGTVGANVTSVNNTNLSRNTTYRYRIRAYNASGDSAYSNIATATTNR